MFEKPTYPGDRGHLSDFHFKLWKKSQSALLSARTGVHPYATRFGWNGVWYGQFISVCINHQMGITKIKSTLYISFLLMTILTVRTISWYLSFSRWCYCAHSENPPKNATHYWRYVHKWYLWICMGFPPAMWCQCIIKLY